MSAEMTLPEGWIDTKFTDFLDVQGGTQPPKSNFIYEPTEGYIRYKYVILVKNQSRHIFLKRKR